MLKEFRTNLAVAVCGIPHQQQRRRRPSIDEVPNKYKVRRRFATQKHLTCPRGVPQNVVRNALLNKNPIARNGATLHAM